MGPSFTAKALDITRNHPPDDGDAFDMRALDTAIQGGILMHQLSSVCMLKSSAPDVKSGGCCSDRTDRCQN
eukprot:s19_g1.t1